MPDRSLLRATRASVFTWVCVGLAATGHRLASGMWPSSASLVLAAGLVLLLANKLGRRQQSLPGIAAALLAGECGLHTLFNAGAASTAMADEPPMTAHLTTGMVTAHLLAALVAAWWLRQGEAALWACCLWFSTLALGALRALFAGLAGRSPRPAVAPIPVVPDRSPTRSRLLRHAVSRRGPPCLTAPR